jgi:hypothetical protein
MASRRGTDMGHSVTILKNGKFRLKSSVTDGTTPALSRAAAILYLINRFSPYDFIKEFYAFPDQWCDERMRLHLNKEGREAYHKWFDGVETDEQV